MRLLSTLILSTLFSLGFFWTWVNYPEIRTFTTDLIYSGKFQTLEVHHSAESIMLAHKKELLKDHNHSFLEPDLKFHPYLLMEVKYSKSAERTGEGIILWSLVDGEMVTNTTSWETTHGFMDCIRSNANRDDFKIINTLANHNGSLNREELSGFLNVESEILEFWLDNCKKKNLVIQKGNAFRLHLQNPKLPSFPETKIDRWLVTKSAKNANRIPRRYRPYQIEKIAKAAFGSDFAIRKTTEIFLPVFSIVVQNPDGSQMSSYWNALNGKRFSQTFHIE